MRYGSGRARDLPWVKFSLWNCCMGSLGQFGQQPASTGDGLANAHPFLHVPDAGGDGMDHGNFEVFLHRDDIDDAPGAGAE